MGLGLKNEGRLRIDSDLSNKQHFLDLIKLSSGGRHQIGTARMSENTSNGVVDLNCKLHGVRNLYCAGSSVFSTTSWVNPIMTIVALSIRLADHILKK